MTQGTATPPSQREDRIMIVFVRQEEYDAIISQPQKFRALHDKAVSVKLGVTTRRIKLRNGQAWTVHPSFVMPRMTGCTEEVAKALYLRKYGVPYEGLVYVFGRDENYWYRMEMQFGEKNIVAVTVEISRTRQEVGKLFRTR